MLCLFVSAAASTASFVRGMIKKVLVFGNSFQAPFNGCCELGCIYYHVLDLRARAGLFRSSSKTSKE